MSRAPTAAPDASRESARPSASASPPTIRTSPPPPGEHRQDVLAHPHTNAQGHHFDGAALEATQGQSHPPQQHDLLGAGEKSNLAAPDALKPTSAIPALDYFKRHWYKDWFKDRSVEKSDPYGFSSAGTSRNITRSQTPLPPAEGNYESARRNSLATAAAANEAV